MKPTNISSVHIRDDLLYGLHLSEFADGVEVPVPVETSGLTYLPDVGFVALATHEQLKRAAWDGISRVKRRMTALSSGVVAP